jgi:hypothetical protein
VAKDRRLALENIMNRRQTLTWLGGLSTFLLPITATQSAVAETSKTLRLVKSKSEWAALLPQPAYRALRRLGIAVMCTLGVVASTCAVAAGTTPVKTESTGTALFAGGCFWCIEADFEKLPGVIGAESGYTAGTKPNPTYKQVSAGGTGHTEAVRVTYEPGKVSYAQLVDFFWKHIDPTVKDRQFCDSGNQYRSGIYWQNAVTSPDVVYE